MLRPVFAVACLVCLADACGSPKVTPPPGAPAQVIAVAGNGNAAVSWMQPDLADGTLSYTVSAAPGPATATTTATSATVLGLTNGTSYTFTVVATGSGGAGPASAPSNAVTPMAAASATIPAAPVITDVTPGPETMRVRWSAISNGGVPITSFAITAVPSPADAAPVDATEQGDQNIATLTGFSQGIAYTFTMVATNAIGDSPASASYGPVELTAATLPGSPGSAVAVGGPGSATVIWTPPADTGGMPITSYTISTDVSDAGPSDPITVDGQTNETIITGLASAETYAFEVRATNAVGTSPPKTTNPVTPTSAGGVSLTLTAAPQQAFVGESLVAKAVATDSEGIPVPGLSVDLSVGDTTVTRLTNTLGIAELSTAPHAAGALAIGASAGAMTAQTQINVSALPACDVPSFVVGAPIGTVGEPLWVATGDFNADGRPDLAVAIAPATLEILAQQSDGSFGPPTTFVVDSSATAIGQVVSADFNGDGIVDLMVANPSDAFSLSTQPFFGAGDGTFQQASPIDVRTFSTRLVPGDFNGDGWPDFAFSDPAAKVYGFALTEGGPAGWFSEYFGLGPTPGGLAAGDLNGDGIPELVIADGDDSLTVTSPTGSLDWGDAGPPMLSGLGVELVDVVVADFDGNGTLDIAAADSQLGVSILAGHGDGTFGPAVAFAQVTRPVAIVTGDFNGDGVIDLATANGALGQITVLIGDGHASFALAVVPHTGGTLNTLAAVDLDGDGRLDSVAPDSSANDLIVLLNQCGR